MPISELQNPEKKGWMHKRGTAKLWLCTCGEERITGNVCSTAGGQGTFKNWRYRYFVLSGTHAACAAPLPPIHVCGTQISSCTITRPLRYVSRDLIGARPRW